jgi:hypothetical protein
MSILTRLRSAAKPAALHLFVSFLVASAVAALVFLVWYPAGIHGITGGAALFLILMAVDIVCGPALTLILFDPRKPAWKWRVDLGLIVLIQVGALGYGLSQVVSARPVFLGFEGDRIRVVQAIDLDGVALSDAPMTMRQLPWGGPVLIGVRLAQSTDPEFLESLQLSLQGNHPSMRPARWIPIEQRAPELLRALKPLESLMNRDAATRRILAEELRAKGLAATDVGYLPLVRDNLTDWIVLLRRSDTQPLAYLHVDGWE